MTQTNTVTGTAFSVHHEWGALKEVIVGVGQDAIVPKWSEFLKWAAPEMQAVFKKYGGQRLSAYDPKWAADLIEQTEALARKLADLGVIVHRLEPLTEAEWSYMTEPGDGLQTFARDAIIVIGDKVIEASLKIPCRRKERFGFRKILDKLLSKQDYRNWVSVPPASPDLNKSDGPFLEGGDVLLNGYEIYVGVSSLGSNILGAKWLQGFLGEKYKVMPIRLAPNGVHIDGCLTLIKPGLGLICRTGLADSNSLPGQLREFEFIEVKPEEASRLGTNCLVLDEKKMIMDTAHERIAEKLRDKGQEIILLPYQAPSFYGGAFRCSHHPIRRESILN